jgi:hypothetical protein
MQTRIACGIATVLVLMGSAGTSAELGPKAASGVEGFWKMCYSPGLAGVDEIDSGYLALMPEGRYYELTESCCHTEGDPGPPPPYWTLDTYRVEGETVVFNDRTHAGDSYERRLTLRRGVSAVFFDAPRAAAVTVDALTHDGDLNYGWCRIYPGAGS